MPTQHTHTITISTPNRVYSTKRPCLSILPLVSRLESGFAHFRFWISCSSLMWQPSCCCKLFSTVSGVACCIDQALIMIGRICGSEVVYLSRICVHLSQQICGVYLSCICVHLSRYPGRKGKVPPTGVTPASDSGCQNNGDSMCHLFIDIWISGQCGYFFFYNSSSLYVHTAIWSFCQIVVGPF